MCPARLLSLAGMVLGFVLAPALLPPLLAPPSALAGPIEIVSSSVEPDASARQTTFTITFNRKPDLFAFNRDGQPRDSFQYFYNADAPNSASADGIFDGPHVSIIRGPEIPYLHEIPIRDSINPTGQDFPHAEGWGPLRDELPFQLEGVLLRFIVPWKSLKETDGHFSYHLIALDQGSQTTDVMATVIPLPSPLYLALTTAPVVLYIARRHRRKV